MTLLHETRQALDRLPVDAGPQRLLASHDGQRLDCALASLERVGCSVESLELESDALAGSPMDRLRQVSEAICRRVTYLLEPVAPVEVDEHHAVVQLRSNPPEATPQGRGYYELLVSRQGAVTLKRYFCEPGQPRTAVPAHLTRQVLLRLVDDLSECAK